MGKGILLGAAVCLLSATGMAADYKLPSGCEKAIKSAVLKKAKDVNDTASVAGVKVLYGDDNTNGDVIIVRVSDEVDPSDYIVVTEKVQSARKKRVFCKFDHIHRVGDGMLPEIPGLER